MANGTKKDRTQRYGQSQLEAGYGTAAERGGGIKPEAHPEFEKPTPLDKAVATGRYIVKTAINFTKKGKKQPQ